MKKKEYKIGYTLQANRLFVDAWDIYNQLINVLPETNAKELLQAFNRAEKKLKDLLK